MSAFAPRSAGFRPLLTSIGAVAAALLLGAIFLEATGKDALEAYRILIERGLTDRDGLTETIKKMAPLLILSSGLLLAIRAGVWNIGIDGQFLVGALCSAVVGSALVGDVPDWVMWIAAALAGIAGGLLWAFPPAILRSRFGLNEIITTLMMNYVAINVCSWLVKGPAGDPDLVSPQTTSIPPEHRLPAIPGLDVHIGVLVALLVTLMVGLIFARTIPGFMLTVMGKSRRVAIHAGIPVTALTVAVLLASGGLAGLAGANDILGVQGSFRANWQPEYGFTAFALVYLARFRALALIPFAFFFSFLLVGGESMPRRADVPTYFIEMLEGLMLLCFAIAIALERGWQPVPTLPVESLTEGEMA